jgi:hypothetical protein
MRLLEAVLAERPVLQSAIKSVAGRVLLWVVRLAEPSAQRLLLITMATFQKIRRQSSMEITRTKSFMV